MDGWIYMCINWSEGYALNSWWWLSVKGRGNEQWAVCVYKDFGFIGKASFLKNEHKYIENVYCC